MQKETIPTHYSVLAVTWPCVVIIGVLLIISAVNIVALSATRAYVAGNSAWASAERQTSALLLGYSRTGDPELLAALNAQVNVVLGDRTARLELIKARPNGTLARNGLLAGGNHPDDVQSMIWLFRAARLFGVADEPLRIWGEADEQFLNYLPLEQETTTARSRGEPSAAQIDDWAQRVHLIHDPLTQLERHFASSMDEYARRLTAFLLGFLAASTAVLLIAGYSVSRRLIRRTSAMAVALQVSQGQVFAEQELAHVLLRSISDAVISTDRHGRIEFLNTAAEQLTGWSATEARGLALESVFRVVQGNHPDDATVGQAIAAVLSGGKVQPLSTFGAQLIRRDHSTTAVAERAAALHNRSGEIVGMVLVMRDVTTERHLWEQLRHQADHDALTGLPNRAHFERRLALSMQASIDATPRFTVMFVDLDEFKAVNDTCGHRAGDELLRRIGPCIREQLRTDDLLARLGGDEFGLLLPACDLRTALHIAQRVCHAVEALQFFWDGKPFTVKASVGVVLDDRALSGVTDVLGAADRACYAAKKSGRNGVCIYSAAEDSRSWRVVTSTEPSA